MLRKCAYQSRACIYGCGLAFSSQLYSDIDTQNISNQQMPINFEAECEEGDYAINSPNSRVIDRGWV